MKAAGLFVERASIVLVISIIGVFAVSGCQSTARKLVYSAWEKVGVEKRDLLKDRIEDVRDEQKDAGKTFSDALERLRAVYHVDDGKLPKLYDKLKSSYDEAVEDSLKVKRSIQKMETVADDLFKEWEKEAEEIKTTDLRVQSRARLTETRARYQTLHTALKTAEDRMDPALSALKDHVLYMKHNLNAQAIASLKPEASNIEKNIQQLIERMNKSIAEADHFIKQGV